MSIYRSFNTMCWPVPCERMGDLVHSLTWGAPTKSDLLLTASVIAAYQHLIAMPTKKRDAIIRELRKEPGIIKQEDPA